MRAGSWKINKRRSIDRVLAIVLASFQALAIWACSRGPSDQDAQTERSRDRGSTPAATSLAEFETPFSTLLEEWATADRDPLIRRVLALSSADSVPGPLRLFQLTEDQFIAFPQATRSALQEEMLPRLKALRELAHEIDQRAAAARIAGEAGKWADYLQCLKRLGAANRGQSVTKLVGLAGKAIEELADRRLAENPPDSK